MLKEIGSEFWDINQNGEKQKYLLSGRTALEYIIRDILLNHNVKSVLMPSYCCDTMLEPFIRNGIKIRFYDVYFDSQEGMCVQMPEFKKDEILYYMTYFGYSQMNGISIDTLREKYNVIIEDCTHSWLSQSAHIESDYSFTSYRKWTGLPGIALAKKREGCFSIPTTGLNYEYLTLRKKAFGIKNKYILQAEGDKEEYLKLFNQAEDMLENDYVGYEATIDGYQQLVELDTERMIETRRQNAKVLIERLKELKDIQLLYLNMAKEDVPLFVPILIKENRNELRKYLIKNSVYCPIHWPISKYHSEISERGMKLYQTELSLVCDQRYDRDDMERLAGLIYDYYQ